MKKDREIKRERERVALSYNLKIVIIRIIFCTVKTNYNLYYLVGD